MLPRVLLTVALLILAATAAALIDCSSTTVELFGGDPIGICSTASSLGLTVDIWVGLGLAGLVGLSLAWTWVPALRPGERRRRLAATQSLERNLGRLPEVGGAADRSEDSPPDRDFMADLWRGLEAVEVSLASDGASRQATERWMGLLREANDLHNSGELSTEQFKEINTRLLDLFTRPSELVDL